MTAPTHVVFGAAAALAAAKFTGAALGELSWLAILLGSLAPDLDAKRSTISRPGSLLERLLPKPLVNLLNAAGRLLGWLVSNVFGHRGALHWPVFGIALLCAGLLLELQWLAWFGLAYLGHILADFCTKGGVPLFGPLSTRNISWSPIRTGSFLEVMVCFALCLFILSTGFHSLPYDAQRRITAIWHQLRGAAVDTSD